MKKANGLVIRFFSGGFYVCDGKSPDGYENDGELYIGNAVKWFATFEEAKELLEIINAAYGYDDKNLPEN